MAIEQKYHPLQHLKELNNNYSPDIPPTVLHSDSPNNRFKVRGSWWVGARADVENILSENLITDPKKVDACQAFIDRSLEIWQRTPDLFDPRFNKFFVRVTSDDVAYAEMQIRIILGEDETK